MRSVSIKLLSGRLSEYVRLAASGETVLVTDRGRVIAEIGPPQETRSPILAYAGCRGWLTPSAQPNAAKLPVPKPVAPLEDLLGELDDDRSER